MHAAAAGRALAHRHPRAAVRRERGELAALAAAPAPDPLGARIVRAEAAPHSRTVGERRRVVGESGSPRALVPRRGFSRVFAQRPARYSRAA